MNPTFDYFEPKITLSKERMEQLFPIKQLSPTIIFPLSPKKYNPSIIQLSIKTNK